MESLLPSSPIDVLLKPVNSFINNQSSGGIVLFLAALIAMVWANSPFSSSYHDLWHIKFTVGFEGFSVSKDLHHWINDGLMSLFFFVVGLEMKREIVGGELSNPRNAILPLSAAVGGMVVPALLYILLNRDPNTMSAWGVPMATDIAFALGIMALLGNKVPIGLKVFLTVLAIADDLGAVLVIAFFYTSNINLISLGTGILFLIVLVGLNLLGVRKTWIYGLIGIGGVWLAFLMSGVHATIAGVLAALTIPASVRIDEKAYVYNLNYLKEKFASIIPNNNALVTYEQLKLLKSIKKITSAAETPLQKLESGMHPLVLYVVMPVFALANAGITLKGLDMSVLFQPLTYGVFTGLVAGKFIGIFGIVLFLVHKKWVKLPERVNLQQMAGAAVLAGVGFTMSLFITELALKDTQDILATKAAILAASLLCGAIGYLILLKSTRYTLNN